MEFFLLGVQQNSKFEIWPLVYPRTDHSFPSLMICANSGIEVIKYDELVCMGCCRYDSAHSITEFVFDFICVGHRRRIGTYDGCIFIARKGKPLIEKYKECHSHKPQPTPDNKRKRQMTKTNTYKTRSTRKSHCHKVVIDAFWKP